MMKNDNDHGGTRLTEGDTVSVSVPAPELSHDAPTNPPNVYDAAEMLWVVLANVSGGDWAQQSEEWQQAAARWRDYYFQSIAKAAPREVRDEEPQSCTCGTLTGVHDDDCQPIPANLREQWENLHELADAFAEHCIQCPQCHESVTAEGKQS